MSQKAQNQKLQKINCQDKKIMRLINVNDITDKDLVFVNNAYEQYMDIQFRYGIGFTAISTIVLARTFTRFSPPTTQAVFFVGGFLLQHMFWSSRASERMEGLISPYFEKYEIK